MLEKIREIEINQHLSELLIINDAILEATHKLLNEIGNNTHNFNKLQMLKSRKERTINTLKSL